MKWLFLIVDGQLDSQNGVLEGGEAELPFQPVWQITQISVCFY